MKNIIALILMTIAVGVVSVGVVSAQQPQPDQPQQPRMPPPPPPDMLNNSVFPPDVIMEHQRELGLTDQQKAFMRGEINKTSTVFNDLQWQLQDAMEALRDTMKADQVNEQLALAQLDKVLDSEREIKKLHMALAIRIKNSLTAEQVQKLQELNRRGNGRGFGRGQGEGSNGPGPGRPGGTGLGAPDGPRPRSGGPGGPPGGPGRPPRPNEFEI
jgi:Spy/CpxP family protein refolding chaperone